MPLNLTPNDGGDFTPFIKYNAKAGRWYIREEGRDGDQEVVNPVLVFDFKNIKTGWIFYPPAGSGSGPEKVWDPAPTIMAAKPAGKDFKRGFEVVIFGDPRSNVGRNIGLREFSSTAGAMIGPLLALHAEYERSAAANPGKAPVFACTGVEAVTGIHGTNYKPTFRLSGWIPRDIFDADQQQQRQPAQSRTPPPASSPASPPNGTVEQWPLALALSNLEAAKISNSKDKLREMLKMRGHAGYNAVRDTQMVKDMIFAAATAPTDEPLDDSPPPNMEDVPF